MYLASHELDSYCMSTVKVNTIAVTTVAVITISLSGMYRCCSSSVVSLELH